MPMPRFLSSLRVRLLLLVLVTALPGLGLILYEGLERWELATHISEQHALDHAREISREHEGLIQSGHRLLQALTEITSVRAHDGESCNRLFSKMVKAQPAFMNLGAAKPDGDVFCSAIPLTQPVNFADRPYFQQALRTRDLAVSEYLVGRISGKPNIAIAYPAVDSSGVVQAVVLVGLSLDWFNNFVAELRLPQGSVATLTDHNGMILARYPEPEKWIGKLVADTPVFKAILSNPGEGVVEATGLDGARHLYGFTKLSGLGPGRDIYVSVGVPEKIAFSEVRKIIRRDLTLIGIVLALSLAGVWFGAGHFITRPVNDLVGATKRLAAGDLSARTGLSHGEGELNQLARSFDQMAESLRRITHRNELILNSAGEGIFGLDCEEKATFVNPAAAEMLGHEVEQLIGQPTHPIFHQSRPDGTPYPSEECPIYAALKDGTTHHITDEVFWKKDGTSFPVEYISTPIKEDGKLTGAVVTFKDITERKRAEEEVRRNLERIQALREIDQAISSTLNLDVIFNVLLEKVDTFLLYPAATMVRLFNQQTRALEFFTCRNLDKDEWKARDASSQGGRAKAVFEAKEPLLVRNVQTDPRTWEPEFFRKHGLVSYLGVPLTAKGQPLGVLSLYTKQEHEFSKEEVDFISTLAGQAAIAIQNSQLYEQTKKQAEELKKAMAEMEISNKVKNQFLSVMSHELRTPLNVVLGYTGMLRDGMLGEIPPEQKKVLGKVINRAGDLLTLIRDVLQTTQIESRSVIVERQLVSLLDFLDKLRTGYDPSLDKEVNFVWDYPRDLPPVITDSEKLKQILQNLIHNAIKFTEKGSVTISVRVTESSKQKAESSKQATDDLPTADRLLPTGKRWLEFKVADSGIGISKELLPVIFEKFIQADSTETRLYGGVGLGLYIAKKFTEMLGGTVQVESEPGKGSTFTVTLPLEQ